MVVKDSKIVEKLFTLIKTDANDIKREAAWAISNATNRGTSADI